MRIKLQDLYQSAGETKGWKLTADRMILLLSVEDLAGRTMGFL
jgi:hypothetical protein